MAKRKAQLTEEYDNLWIDGDTNVVICEVLIPMLGQVEAVREQLFFYNYIAEFISKPDQLGGIEKDALENHKIDKSFNRRVRMVTTSWNIPNVNAVLEKNLGNAEYDLIALEVATGNKHYINWVKQQTVEVGKADIEAIRDAKAALVVS